MVPEKLLGILACPRCKGDIQEKGMFILCRKCKLAFPVLGGTVPDMLISDAWPLEKVKKTGFRHKMKL